eukprot:689308-Hanusia_phi.AAC.1
MSLAGRRKRICEQRSPTSTPARRESCRCVEEGSEFETTRMVREIAGAGHSTSSCSGGRADDRGSSSRAGERRAVAPVDLSIAAGPGGGHSELREDLLRAVPAAVQECRRVVGEGRIADAASLLLFAPLR